MVIETAKSLLQKKEVFDNVLDFFNGKTSDWQDKSAVCGNLLGYNSRSRRANLKIYLSTGAANCQSSDDLLTVRAQKDDGTVMGFLVYCKNSQVDQELQLQPFSNLQRVGDEQMAFKQGKSPPDAAKVKGDAILEAWGANILHELVLICSSQKGLGTKMVKHLVTNKLSEAQHEKAIMIIKHTEPTKTPDTPSSRGKVSKTQLEESTNFYQNKLKAQPGFLQDNKYIRGKPGSPIDQSAYVQTETGSGNNTKFTFEKLWVVDLRTLR